MKYKRIYTEKEGKWFVSHFPLFGLASQGRTKKEAEEAIVEAVGLFVVGMLENNSVDIFIEEMRK